MAWSQLPELCLIGKFLFLTFQGLVLVKNPQSGQTLLHPGQEQSFNLEIQSVHRFDELGFD
jgi:hypothetical protein